MTRVSKEANSAYFRKWSDVQIIPDSPRSFDMYTQSELDFITARHNLSISISKSGNYLLAKCNCGNWECKTKGRSLTSALAYIEKNHSHHILSSEFSK